MLVTLFTLVLAALCCYWYCRQPARWSQFYPYQPFFMGHRGVMTRAPENTVAAYHQALEAGFTGTELDVIETRDGHLVCSHNFDLERVTDGSGYLFERDRDYVKKINAAHRFDGYEFEHMPLLTDVLELFPEDFRLNIEVKPRSLADVFTPVKVARMIKERNMQERVIISSFNPLALLGVKWVDKSILTGFLLETETWPLLKLINLAHPDCLHLEAGLVSRDLLRYARQRGMAVNVWTVNNQPAIDWLVELGVDGIITDYPELCRLRPVVESAV